MKCCFFRRSGISGQLFLSMTIVVAIPFQHFLLSSVSVVLILVLLGLLIELQKSCYVLKLKKRNRRAVELKNNIYTVKVVFSDDRYSCLSVDADCKL